MTRNIFFDLDGTLIDCKKRLYNLFTDLAPSHGLTFEDYASLKSKQVNQREMLVKYCGYDEADVELFRLKWLNLIEDPERLMSDSVIGFNELDRIAKRYDLYIVTNRQNKESTLAQLESLGLLQFFKDVLVTEQKTSKTKLIQKYVHCLDPMDIIIGDTCEDIITGKELGIQTVAVESGFLSKDVLLRQNPDFIIKSVRDLYETCCL